MCRKTQNYCFTDFLNSERGRWLHYACIFITKISALIGHHPSQVFSNHPDEYCSFKNNCYSSSGFQRPKCQEEGTTEVTCPQQEWRTAFEGIRKKFETDHKTLKTVMRMVIDNEVGYHK